jgi:hypothetical protein
MKSLAALLLIVATPVLAASSSLSLEGRQAKALMTTLEDAGSFTEGAAGKHVNVVSNLQCRMFGNAEPPRHYECSFDGIDETGAEKSFSAKDPVARRLWNQLTRAGVPSDCGAGKCGLDAESVKCGHFIAEEPAAYRCEILAPSLN